MQEIGTPFVDQFMAITGADGTEASFYLSHHSNNLEKALFDFFEDPTKAHKHIQRTNMLDSYRLFKGQEEKQNCLIRKIDVKGRALIDDVKILWKEIVPSVLRGATPGEEFLMEIGGQPQGMTFHEGTFDEALKVAYDVDRSLLLLVYTEALRNAMHQIFTADITNMINQSFIALGLLSTNEELTKSLKQQIPSQPSLNIFRVNLTNEVVLMSEYDIHPHTPSADVISFLRRSLESIREVEKLEGEIKMQVNSELHTHNTGIMDDLQEGFEMEGISNLASDYSAEREIRMQQEQEFMQMVRQHERKKSQQLEEVEKEKQEQEKFQYLQQDRKVRKMSLPDEPSDGDIITISFRLPMGGRLLRSFNKGERVEMIYSFIELQEKVQLQNEVERKFDLLTLAPSQSLSDKRRLTLEEVFGEETQEVLLIKEL